VRQADILESRALDESRSEKENGSSVNYESAVSEIAIMMMLKFDRLILLCKRTHMWVKKREKKQQNSL
jgi:hypothetical protein